MANWKDNFVSFANTIAKWWALGGGLVLLGVVAVNVGSVIGDALFQKPFPGVYEIVQIGAAVSMFMAIPHCQMSGSNVTADIFTSGLKARTIAWLGGLGAVFGLLMAVFLFWRMSYGLEDVYTYRETTAIYQFPIWIAYVPVLVSLALFVLAAIANLIQATQGILPEYADWDRMV